MMMRYAAAAAAAITAFGMLAMATMATGDCGVLGTYECVSEAIKYETLGDGELGFIPVAGKSLTSFDMVTVRRRCVPACLFLRADTSTMETPTAMSLRLITATLVIRRCACDMDAAPSVIMLTRRPYAT